MGRPGGCDCRCGGDSSDSSHTSSESGSSSGSSISSDSSWSSSHGDAGCFDCCPVLPVEWSMWWPGFSRPPGTTPGWMLSCLGPEATYLCAPRGTYKLRLAQDRCAWVFKSNPRSLGCWYWELGVVCVRDLVEPPAGVSPDTTRIELRHGLACGGELYGIDGSITVLGGTWRTYIEPSSDPRRCAQQHTLNLVTEVQSVHCIIPVPPFTDVLGDYETPATIQIWPS